PAAPPGAAAPPPPVSGAPAPTQPAPSEGSSGSPPAAAGGQMSFGASTSGPDTTGGDEREPFFSWYGRKPLAWVGTGIAGVGLILGLTGSIIALDAANAADDDAAVITRVANERNIKQPCSKASPERDLPDFHDACNTLRDDHSKHDTGMTV